MIETPLDSTDPSDIIELRKLAEEAHSKIKKIIEKVTKKHLDYYPREYFINELSEKILIDMGMLIKKQE